MALTLLQRSSMLSSELVDRQSLILSLAASSEHLSHSILSEDGHRRSTFTMQWRWND